MHDLNSYEKLPRSFYKRPDVVSIARELLGKFVFTNIDGNITAGKIVETEAYSGRNDKACHAHKGRTRRTETMFLEGGHAYVYLCYGIHHLFNIVTNEKDLADAVLIRGLEPIINLEEMQNRRGAKVPFKRISAGPGTLSQALGIQTTLDRTDLTKDMIWIATLPAEEKLEIETDRRVGVDYAAEDSLLPWRFYIKDNAFVSMPKQTESKIFVDRK